jgi:hypothetical protein
MGKGPCSLFIDLCSAVFEKTRAGNRYPIARERGQGEFHRYNSLK